MSDNWNDRMAFAIYAQGGAPGFQVFDADLFEGRVDPAMGTPKDFTVYCMVVLEPGKAELVLDQETQMYRLRTDVGTFTAEQVFLGEAGDTVDVTR